MHLTCTSTTFRVKKPWAISWTAFSSRSLKRMSSAFPPLSCVHSKKNSKSEYSFIRKRENLNSLSREFFSNSLFVACNVALRICIAEQATLRGSSVKAKRSDDFDDEDTPNEEEKLAEAEKVKKQKEKEEFLELVNEAKVIGEKLEEEYKDSTGSEEAARERAERLREELVKKAMEQVERRKRVEALFQYGQRAYGSGVYNKSVEIFQAALEEVDKGSLLGGEIQIWLAQAYDANRQMGDCIALYRELEKNHPSMKIRRQAANLRFITEAPKIKPSKDEILTIPLLDYDNNSTSETWSQMVRRKRQPKIKKKVEKDYWETWERPKWEESPFFWVALTIWLTLIGVALYQ